MKYLRDYKEGDRVLDVYLCKHKQSAVTKNGKSYDNVILQDKTGIMDAKIWDPNSAGIAEFERENLLERQREGIAIAKAEGKYKGRKAREIDNEFIQAYDQYKRRELNKVQMAKQLNISRPTLDKLIEEYERTEA